MLAAAGVGRGMFVERANTSGKSLSCRGEVYRSR